MTELGEPQGRPSLVFCRVHQGGKRVFESERPKDRDENAKADARLPSLQILNGRR